MKAKPVKVSDEVHSQKKVLDDENGVLLSRCKVCNSPWPCSESGQLATVEKPPVKWVASFVAGILKNYTPREIEDFMSALSFEMKDKKVDL